MPSALDQTSYAPLLKTTYVQEYIDSLALGKSVLLALLEKETEIDVVGNKVAWPVITSDAGKRSADPTVAFGTQADTTGMGGAQFIASIKGDYWSGSVDGITAKASMKKEGGFESALTKQADMGMRKTGKQIGLDVYTGGYGVVGHYVSDDGNLTMQLLPGEAWNLAKNDKVFFTAQTDVAVARAAGALLTVNFVDYVLDKVTFTTVISAITSIAAGDRLIMEGDRSTSAVTVPSKITGLDAYITATGTTNLHGVDTTQDQGLRGLVFDYTTGVAPYAFGNIHDVVIDGCTATNRMGGDVSHVMMNSLRWGDYVKYLTTRKIFFKDSEAKPGFKSITLADGTQIVPDPACPMNNVYFLTLKTWKLGTLLETVPSILDLDGQQWLRQNAADGVAMRVGAYIVLMCEAPLWNAKAILPTRT